MIRILRAIKRWPRALRGRDFFLLPRSTSKGRQIHRLGSDYGGWVCLPGKLSSKSTVYSFGVGTDISFDEALIAMTGCTVHAFDPTPGSAQWIQSQRLPAKFCFYGFGLADRDGHQIFRKPDIRGYFSPSAVLNYPGEGVSLPVHRLGSIMRRLGHTKIDLLKMDIEGAEYSVLTDMLHSGIRPAQLLVEFHHRIAGVGIHQTRIALRNLQEAGYDLLDVSPRGEEFTFARFVRGEEGSGAESR